MSGSTRCRRQAPALITDAFNDLGDALERAAADQPPEGRLRAVLAEVRAWAIAEPHRYGPMCFDPDLLYEAEVDTIVASL